jgi:hypothetical protein
MINDRLGDALLNPAEGLLHMQRAQPSAALGPKKPLDKFFPFLYCEEWNNNTKSNAR